ncbi:hypothetical protein BCR36DRAFT_579249 [Piromyces finnis]|uniref:Peptidase C14 caspase domain-containing protein n=1 Tax=Piromyces finnis TaxID=1754191 RepID=A0A1Y1VP72_9FUNG|nr:hypothetical protein BCR36DRAFT_579249 [Piromyces finnis]|eukprot:ORX61219.1 hypothetical protein BCR36DRAFT_579249 [Piromyces finnis]
MVDFSPKDKIKNIKNYMSNNREGTDTNTIKSSINSHINNQLKIQEIWNTDTEKFYNDRDGDNFIRSDCSGKKKAVYIGINYVNSSNKLIGCVNDANNISELFSRKFGFNDYILLTDDTNDENKMPTHDNIINAINWLVKDIKAGDSLVFHFSGHGQSVLDKDGDEWDGFDESILPCDYTKKGRIIDDDIYHLLVEPIPKGCKLTTIFDCCHSGTIMDLPYTYQCPYHIEVIENDLRKAIYQKTNEVFSAIINGDSKEISKSLQSVFDGSIKKVVVNGTNPETIKRLQCNGEVIQFSGCRDDQKSADIKMGDVISGAMSHYLIKLLNKDREYTYIELLSGIRQYLCNKNITQIPQLSSSRPISFKDKFTV